MHTLNVFDKMINYKNQTTEDDTYYSVVDIILSNLDQLQELNIYELADLCFTSTASIGRFCKMLGYSGFSEFKKHLIATTENLRLQNHLIPPEIIGPAPNTLTVRNTFCDIMDRQSQMLRSVPDSVYSEILHILADSDNVYVFAAHPFPEMVRVLSINLLLNGKKLYYHCDRKSIDEALGQVKKKDCVIFFNPSLPQTTYLEDLVNDVKSMDVKMLHIITDPKASDQSNLYASNYVELLFPALGTGVDLTLIVTLMDIIAYMVRNTPL